MFIKASKLSELRKSRQDYVDNYNSRLAEYKGQVEKYRQTKQDYFDAIAAEVKESISPEIDKFPGITITANEGYEEQCCVTIVYNSKKQENYSTHLGWEGPRSSGYRGGISFTLIIFLRYIHTQDKPIVDKYPKLTVDFLESDDYDMLADMRDLFKKIDSIKWLRILSKANKKFPKEAEHITAEKPGGLNTSYYDRAIVENQIEQTFGKDLWIKVRYTGPSTRADNIWGDCWIRLVKVARAFYYVNAVEDYAVRGQYLPLSEHTDEWRATSALRDSKKERKLRKDGFDLPETLQVMTTEELIGEVPAEEGNSAE